MNQAPASAPASASASAPASAPASTSANAVGMRQIVPAFPAVKTRPTVRVEYLRMLQGQKLLKQCLRAWREDVAASKESSSSGENTDGPVEDAMRVMRARKQPVSGQPLWEQVREQ